MNVKMTESQVRWGEPSQNQFKFHPHPLKGKKKDTYAQANQFHTVSHFFLPQLNQELWNFVSFLF